MAGVLLAPCDARAEWQVRPSLGIKFGGSTTFVDLDEAASRPKLVLSVAGGFVGEVLGIEADFGRVPGYFQSGDPELIRHLVVGSSVTTLTGGVVVALPRRLTEYTLRPYVVGGMGLLRVDIEPDAEFDVVRRVTRTLPALSMGGGATGFVTDRFGLNWELRWFRTIRGTDHGRGESFGPEKLSFWRANMALAFRY
jgi:hypothetical protein